MIRRSLNVRAPDKICFAGGTIEKGEAPEDAIVRELQEELSLTSIAKQHIWSSRTSWGTRLEWIWVARSPSSEPVANPDEVAEWMWMEPDELLSHPDMLSSVPSFFQAWASGEFTLPQPAGQPREEWLRLEAK